MNHASGPDKTYDARHVDRPRRESRPGSGHQAGAVPPEYGLRSTEYEHPRYDERKDDMYSPLPAPNPPCPPPRRQPSIASTSTLLSPTSPTSSPRTYTPVHPGPGTIFCCPFNPAANPSSDSPSVLNLHTKYTMQMLRMTPDDVILSKDNRFFLWAYHGIFRTPPPPSTSTHHRKSNSNASSHTNHPTIPWVYLVEQLDYRDLSSSSSSPSGPTFGFPSNNTNVPPTARYFMFKSDMGGFESVPYGLGHSVRMRALDVKASMMLKCLEHGNWFEVNFYC